MQVIRKARKGSIKDAARIHSERLSIICILYLLYTANKICAIVSSDTWNEDIELNGREGPLYHTIRVLSKENSKMKGRHMVYKILDSGDIIAEDSECKNISLTLNEYSKMKADIYDFDDSLSYESIKIQGDIYIVDEESLKSQEKLLWQFIEAFGNLKSNTLLIKDIIVDEVNSSRGSDLYRKKISTENVLDIEKIIFTNVSEAFILRFLETCTFKDAIQLIFMDKKKWTWDFLLQLPTYKKYRKVEIHNLDFMRELSNAESERISEILSVLVLHYIELFDCKITSKIQQSIISNSIYSVKELILEMSADFWESEINFNSSKYDDYTIKLLVPSPTHLNDDSSQDKEKSQNEVFKQKLIEAVKKTDNTKKNKFNNSSSNLDINIHFLEETRLTMSLLKQIISWAAAKANRIASLTLSNIQLTEKNIDLLGCLKARTPDLPSLKKLCLQNLSATRPFEILLMDPLYKPDMISEHITFCEFAELQDCTYVLPLEIYIEKVIKKKNKGSASHDIQYPGAQDNLEITVCWVCRLNVFTKLGEKTRCMSNSPDIISLKELRNITWKEFCALPEMAKIKDTLESVYDLDYNIKIDENNFYDVVNYILEKPILLLKDCEHTYCIGCFFDHWYSLKNERDPLLIDCPVCRKPSNIFSNIMFPIFQRKLCFEKIENRFLYTTDENEDGNYVFCQFTYPNIFRQKSEFYTKRIPRSFKSVVDITKD